MSTLEIALDWTPNTNHTGLYVAKANGYYEDRGLEVTLRSPAEDGYEQTPAKRVATGDATVAIAPSESAISYNTHPDYPSLTAIAAVCQRDTSAIVTLGDSGLERPADLDGQTYASYDARFEDHIVEQLIRNDGGDGDLEITTPAKLGIWDTLLDGKADATWVFMPWEGLEAERDGIELNAFGLEEYDVPYGYTPVMLARPEMVTNGSGREALSEFLAATARGYEEAVANPETATAILAETADELEKAADFLAESQRRLAPAVLEDRQWGRMSGDRWRAFVDWLAAEEILATVNGSHLPAGELDVDALYTNELLP